MRVNAIGTPWCHADLVALAASGREPVTAVLPKVEHADDLAFADRLLEGAEAAAGPHDAGAAAGADRDGGRAGRGGRDRARVGAPGRARARLRRPRRVARPAGAGAAADWRFAQESVLVAARAAGLQAIDGPYLGTRDDDAFRAAAPHARALGFDGKWAIHPAQLDALREAFTPTDEEVAGAREVLAALDARRRRRRRRRRARRPDARRGARAAARRVLARAAARDRVRRPSPSAPRASRSDAARLRGPRRAGRCSGGAPVAHADRGHAALHQAIVGDRLRLALDRTLGEARARRGRRSRIRRSSGTSRSASRRSPRSA